MTDLSQWHSYCKTQAGSGITPTAKGKKGCNSSHYLIWNGKEELWFKCANSSSSGSSKRKDPGRYRQWIKQLERKKKEKKQPPPHPPEQNKTTAQTKNKTTAQTHKENVTELIPQQQIAAVNRVRPAWPYLLPTGQHSPEGSGPTNWSTNDNKAFRNKEASAAAAAP